MFRQALVLSVLLMAASPVFAGDTCSCSKKCMTNCQMGHSKNCKCKMCDCKKSGKCEDGSCGKSLKGEGAEGGPKT